MKLVVVENVSADELDGWVRIMRRLRKVDPKRFEALLGIAEHVVAAHDDPVGADSGQALGWRSRGQA